MIGCKIDGVVELADGETAEEFLDEFLIWLESKGRYFGGGIGPVDLNDDLSAD